MRVEQQLVKQWKELMSACKGASVFTQNIGQAIF
jgi:hypothetical protein